MQTAAAVVRRTCRTHSSVDTSLTTGNPDRLGQLPQRGGAVDYDGHRRRAGERSHVQVRRRRRVGGQRGGVRGEERRGAGRGGQTGFAVHYCLPTVDARRKQT